VGLLARAAELGIAGGAVYDALVAETARRAGTTLLTRDRRAIAVYEKIGVTFEFVG
jgi:predicted nucleic acid-binding protein